MPPCGVPVKLASRMPSSVITPALRNAFTSASTRLSCTRSSRAVWSISSDEAWSYYRPRGLPASVTITRRRHPLQDLSLRVLGGMRRHGVMELLLELPDGKSLVPARWTDVGRVAGEGDAGAAMLGSLVDLLHVCELIADLRGQAAGMSPCKEDSHAACPAQFDTRPGAGLEHRSGPAPPPAPAPAVDHLPADAAEAAIVEFPTRISWDAPLGPHPPDSSCCDRIGGGGLAPPLEYTAPHGALGVA